ncbi:MAG: hypothetical protein Q4E34_06685, partial [Synergistaceae bacterium]|nr:hypothetical protein [Synergistaceae bacterium]
KPLVPALHFVPAGRRGFLSRHCKSIFTAQNMRRAEHAAQSACAFRARVRRYFILLILSELFVVGENKLLFIFKRGEKNTQNLP